VAADFLTCDWHSDGCEWKVARAGVWRSAPRHITKGEALAAEMLLRWYASQPQVASVWVWATTSRALVGWPKDAPQRVI